MVHIWKSVWTASCILGSKVLYARKNDKSPSRLDSEAALSSPFSTLGSKNRGFISDLIVTTNEDVQAALYSTPGSEPHPYSPFRAL